MSTIISNEKSDKTTGLTNNPIQVESFHKKLKDVCKLEYYVNTFEKEVQRLSKENRELKDKLKKLNLDIDGKINPTAFSGILSIEHQSFELGKSVSVNTEKKISTAYCFSLGNSNVNWTGVETQNENISYDSFLDKVEISSRNHNPNSRIESRTTHSRVSHEIKIMELNNQILKMKSLIQKKNSKIEQYECVMKAYKAVQNDLILSKKNLYEINRKIKTNNPSVVKSNISEDKPERKISFNEQSEYQTQIQQLKEMIDTTEINSKSRETELELSQIIIDNLKIKLNDTNGELLNSQKNYEALKKKLDEAQTKNEILFKKYQDHKEFLKLLEDNLQMGGEIFQQIEEYFYKVKEENGKRFTSFLFSDEMDLDKLDINHIEAMIAFFKKINDVNFIIQISEPGQLFPTNWKKLDLKIIQFPGFEYFLQKYNHYIQKFISMFGLIAKILVNENAKNFYFANNLNKFFKRYFETTREKTENEEMYQIFTQEQRFYESKIPKLVLDKIQISPNNSSTPRRKQQNALHLYFSTVSNYFSEIERYLNKQTLISESDIDS